MTRVRIREGWRAYVAAGYAWKGMAEPCRARGMIGGLALAILGSACGGEASAVPHATVDVATAQEDPCRRVREEQDAIARLAKEGEWAQALLAVRALDGPCEAVASTVLELELLASVGDWEGVLRRVEAVDGPAAADADVVAIAKRAQAMQQRSTVAPFAAGALVAAGMRVLQRGEVDAAQRLFDEAARARRRKAGATVALDVEDELFSPRNYVPAIAWQPGHLYVAREHQLWELDPATLRETRRLRVAQRLEWLAVARAAPRLAARGRSTVVVWDTADFKVLWRRPSQGVGGIALSPAGDQIYLGGEDGVRVVDVASGDLVRHLQSDGGLPRLSPDGAHLVVANAWGITRWRTQAWTKVASHPFADGEKFHDVAFSTDGQHIVATTSHGVRTWRTGAPGDLHVHKTRFGPEEIAMWRDSAVFVDYGHIKILPLGATSEVRLIESPGERSFDAPAVSPDGGRILLSEGEGDFALWDPEGPSEVAHLRRERSRVRGAHLDPLSRRLFVAHGDDEVLAIGLDGEERVTALRGAKTALSKSGDLFAGVVDKRVHLQDARTGETLGRTPRTDGYIGALAFCEDDSLLAVGRHSRIELWTTRPWAKVAVLKEQKYGPDSLAFTKDCRRLAAGEFKTVRLWDVPRRQQLRVLHGHTSWVRALAFTEDGRLVSGSTDSTSRVWSAQGVVPLATLKHGGWVHDYAFLRDGTLAVASAAASSVRRGKGVELWDLDRYERVRQLAVAATDVDTVEVSVDGRTLIASSEDEVVIWRTNGFETVGRLRVVAGAEQGFVFTPAGKVSFFGQGPPPASVQCIDGTVRYPFAACRDRVYVPGLLTKLLGKP